MGPKYGPGSSYDYHFLNRETYGEYNLREKEKMLQDMEKPRINENLGGVHQRIQQPYRAGAAAELSRLALPPAVWEGRRMVSRSTSHNPKY